MTDYVLGVDVAKETLSFCLIHGHEVVLQAETQNEQDQVQHLLASLPVKEGPSLCVAVEPTNTYWYTVAECARRAGYRVVSAPPKATKLFLRSLSPRVKNDKVDAKGIALYAASMDLKTYQPKPQDLKALDELLCVRRKLSENNAYYRQVASTNSAAADVAANMLASSKAQLTELDNRIQEALKKLSPAKRLIKVPGFGPVVTASLVSRLLSIQFKSSDSFVAYVGLDLRVIESGKLRGRRRLSHNGDAELRRLLYLAAQSSIRVKGSPFAHIYQHALADLNLTTTEAICAVARKMGRTAWSIVEHNTSYDPDRVRQQG
jgi:transposase